MTHIFCNMLDGAGQPFVIMRVIAELGRMAHINATRDQIDRERQQRSKCTVSKLAHGAIYTIEGEAVTSFLGIVRGSGHGGAGT
jgi:hypothetical protein